VVPAREETTSVLSRLLTEAAGPPARIIFLIAALAILASTIIGLVDGKARGLRTAARILYPPARRVSDLASYRAGVAILCLVIFAFLFTARPVRLIVLISALEAPVLSLSAVLLVYLLHTRLGREQRPGVAWHATIATGTLVYAVLAGWVLVTTVVRLIG
jgi:hypothetical protein